MLHLSIALSKLTDCNREKKKWEEERYDYDVPIIFSSTVQLHIRRKLHRII